MESLESVDKFSLFPVTQRRLYYHYHTCSKRHGRLEHVGYSLFKRRWFTGSRNKGHLQKADVTKRMYFCCKYIKYSLFQTMPFKTVCLLSPFIIHLSLKPCAKAYNTILLLKNTKISQNIMLPLFSTATKELNGNICLVRIWSKSI